MKLSTALRNKKLGVVVTILIVVMLLPFGSSAARFVLARDAEVPDVFLEMPLDYFNRCVEDTDYMRFRHMDLLKRLREEFIRDGKRGNVSLTKCRDCHTSRERFCNRCHEEASVILDCFGCHYYPEPDSVSQQLGT
ncbi:MAG: hypothetical protein JSW71_14075 [Gemmatimonadota bacterium]|nr:MAG: hypothetical protein JSW71_14075 [Gemmatimonadota bacterium]